MHESDSQTSENTSDKIKGADEDHRSLFSKSVWGVLGAALILLLNKLKSGLLLIKFLKLGKLLTTMSTMGIMILTYSYRYGWVFATGFVLLILVHELGHGWAARRIGIRVGAPIFVPFFGAFIALKDHPRNPFEQFFISAGGPVAGVTAGLICLFIADYFSHSTQHLLLGLGHFTLVMNLFNLIPFGGLDGSGMVAPLRRAEWVWGYPLLLTTTYLSLTNNNVQINPIAMLVLLAGGARAGYSFFKGEEYIKMDETPQSDGQSVQSHRLICATTYFTLTGFLIYMVHASSPSLPKM
jgi:Zn-dependent protease